MLGRVERGPGRHDFHSVLIGPRGVGKTVLLAEVLHQGASRNRWATIHWNASRPLHQALAEQRAGVVRQLQGALRRALPRLDGGVDLKAAPAGVGAEARVRVGSGAQRASSAYGMLAELGQLGARRHGVVIIAADELQAASSEDLQELTAAIQQLANVQGLPVCLIAVGLPATGHLLHSARVSPGFAERLVPLRVENLDAAATRDALATPFHDAGRDIDPAAVELLVTATGGYPYAIQLAGHSCWQAAGDTGDVTTTHAHTAERHLHSTLDAQIYEPRWNAMSPSDRQYLATAAQLCDDHEVVTTAAIANALGRSAQHVTRNRDRLINQHHALRPYERGRVQFAIPGLAAWIRRHTGHSAGEAGPTEDR